MISFLRTKTVRIEAIDRELSITELPAYAHSVLSDKKLTLADQSAQIMVACVPEFATETPEDITRAFSVAALTEICDAVYALSGLTGEDTDAKNSEAEAIGASKSKSPSKPDGASSTLPVSHRER